MSELVILAGGQTGVDRAALDAAVARGMTYGGWCPQGGWAEDCPTPPGLLAKYPLLRETPLADPAQRTEWNVRDADASLILVDAGGTAVSRGTELAQSLAARYHKPLLVLELAAPDAAARARVWLDGLRAAQTRTPFRLAIGGPRESEAPGIYKKARALVAGLLDTLPPLTPR